MQTSNADSTAAQTSIAAFSAIGAFVIWGLVPIYFKQVAHVQALEVLANRVVWSFVLLGLIAWFFGHRKSVITIATDKKQLKILLLSSVLIAVNWLTFIWAISNNRIVETSLGYYLNPIASVLLGTLLLRESLSRPQVIALLLASSGVCWQLFTLGKIPTVSLLLAVSFGLYGLVRKQAALPAIPGLFMETLMLLPIALGFMIWLTWQGESSFTLSDPTTSGLLILAGAITSAPLLLFTSAAPKLRLTTLGFLQYIGPTLSLSLGVLVYGEPFGPNIKISFLFIWAALVVFSIDAVIARRRLKRL
ncbi:EamA family transporter RarD [Parendozoicomonas haliclonae]|uniref:EamA-like transporter family protein n=1 Tax=Parendozoicomonas haliclonae TaxID=1960125 RepID=A0A1X7ANM1_9GAMM|nr:EamA family transporter RarD [Parendozoicomonas haliclonae]SMA49865.1 EamA-like transporter family protein [Parendozoicomonas haliclonae]